MTRIASILLFLTACAPPGEITVSDAWIRGMPPGAKVTAGYFIVQNGTSKPVSLVSATSAQFGRVEFHVTRMENDVARMEQEMAVTVPPGNRISFAPGGRHLMMFDPQSNLESGELVHLILETDAGSKLHVSAEVRSAGASGHHHHE